MPEAIVGGRQPLARRGERPPAVSIIVPVYNAAGALAAAVPEILRQSLKSREVIVIDGGSRDGTREVLKRFEGRIDYWRSAPDRGIYDAMNRGVDAARGQWLYFMGVDDAFYDHRTLADVMHSAAACDDADLIIGDVLLGTGRRFKSRFGRCLYLRNTVYHQAAFYRREVFDHFRYGRRWGNVMRPYRISGDYQLNLDLFTRGRRACYVDRIIARCADGISQQGRLTGYLEEIVIRHGHMPFAAAAVCDIQTIVRFFLKQLTRHLR